jgi:thiamine kinase-like enzyme
MDLSNKKLLNEELTPEVCHELLPEWEGVEIEVILLTGGITNKLYRIRSEKGDYTVRIYGDKTDLFINRDFEIHAIAEMAKIGVGSKLIKYRPEIGVTIVEFIGDSIVLCNDDFKKPELYDKITYPIRKIHDSGVQLKKTFNPMVEIKKMAKILQVDLDRQYPEFDIDGTISRLENLFTIIDIPESLYSACHNDLLADNFIMIKDEFAHRYASPMYIIDWEYAGMAPKYYDIADMFQEVLVPRENEKQIITAYCQGREFDETLRMVNLFKPFPDIYWYLWSLIQTNVSTLDFDFYTYGKEKYENAMGNMEFMNKAYNLSI